MGAVVMVLSLKHQLSEEGYYWFNMPKSAGYPFLALVEHTNFVPPSEFGGEHIIYIGDYLDTDHENFRLSKEELLGALPAVRAEVQPQFLPGMDQEDLAVQDHLRPTHSAGQPFAEYPGHPHPHPRPVLRQHEPGLPLGSRHQFRRADWPKGRSINPFSIDRSINSLPGIGRHEKSQDYVCINRVPLDPKGLVISVNNQAGIFRINEKSQLDCINVCVGFTAAARAPGLPWSTAAPGGSQRSALPRQ